MNSPYLYTVTYTLNQYVRSFSTKIKAKCTFSDSTYMSLKTQPLHFFKTAILKNIPTFDPEAYFYNFHGPLFF